MFHLFPVPNIVGIGPSSPLQILNTDRRLLSQPRCSIWFSLRQVGEHHGFKLGILQARPIFMMLLTAEQTAEHSLLSYILRSAAIAPLFIFITGLGSLSVRFDIATRESRTTDGDNHGHAHRPGRQSRQHGVMFAGGNT